MMADVGMIRALKQIVTSRAPHGQYDTISHISKHDQRVADRASHSSTNSPICTLAREMAVACSSRQSNLYRPQASWDTDGEGGGQNNATRSKHSTRTPIVSNLDDISCLSCSERSSYLQNHIQGSLRRIITGFGK